MVFGISAGMVAAAHILGGVQEPTPIGVSFEALSVSSYIWRGVEVQRSAVVQYDTTFERGSFSLGAWANVPTFQSHGNPDEIDFTFTYSRQVKTLNASTSIVSYTFPADSSAATQELCFDLSLPIGSFDAFLANALDVGLFRGAYYGEAGISAEREISSELSLDARIGFAWATSKFNASYFGVTHSGINGAFGELGLTFSNDDGTYIRPSISIWAITDPSLKAAVPRATMFSFGIGVGIAF